MSDAGPPRPQASYQASSLVVSPRPNEFGFALREDEFQILCEGEVGSARASRDLLFGVLVGAVVGLVGVLATIDWGTIWQPEKRGAFLFWFGLLLVIVVSSATGVVIYHLRLKKTLKDSAYSRLKQNISTWFVAQQSVTMNSLTDTRSLAISSAKYGAGVSWVNVAERLNAKVRNGSLRIPVTNEEFRCDPTPNVAKSLEVEYTHDGRSHTKTVSEGQVLSIPEP
jgi:hypothetical protein